MRKTIPRSHADLPRISSGLLAAVDLPRISSGLLAAVDLPRISSGLLAAVLLTACGQAQDPLQPGEERVDPAEAAIAAQMVEAITDVSRQRTAPGQRVLRFNQVKTLGCFDAEFSVTPGLPTQLAQGVFAQERTYPARLRFANATETDDTEKDFRGLSIKLGGVDGDPLWGVRGEQDFLLNSYPALFAADPGDFLDFIEATRKDAVWRYFVNPRHFYSLKVVLQGRERIANPFAIPYWSTTPFRHGADPGTAVKYSVRPCDGSVPEIAVDEHPDYLADAMRAHLQKAPACFDFMVQLQTDPVAMPIEDASVGWDEADSPFVKVASIRIDPGATSIATTAGCEAMRFNPWQSIEAHRPLGGINRVRLPVYSEIGRFRETQNAGREKD